MEKPLINGNEPTSCTPIILQIATQLMAARITGHVYSGFPYKDEAEAKEALEDTQALINAYNNILL